MLFLKRLLKLSEVGDMDKTPEAAGDNSAQIESQIAEFDLLYRNAFEVRRRLGLDRGYHVFDIDDTRYHRVDVIANTYDDMSVTLYETNDEIIRSVRDIPYTLERMSIIGLKKGGVLRYVGYDSMKFAPSWSTRETFDSELDSDEQEFDFDQPLPTKVAELLGDMNTILPGLTLEQHNDEESECWFDEDQYDVVKQRELLALEEALSTAGGALYLLQLAFLDRYRREISSGASIDDCLRIPKGPHSSFEISASFDPDSGDDNEWFPHIISLKKGSAGSFFSTYGGRFEHTTTHTFFEFSDLIQYEVSDDLEQDDRSLINVDAFNALIAPSDRLSDDVLSLVKQLLRGIVIKGDIDEGSVETHP